jgi:hypothetical protein
VFMGFVVGEGSEVMFPKLNTSFWGGSFLSCSSLHGPKILLTDCSHGSQR